MVNWMKSYAVLSPPRHLSAKDFSDLHDTEGNVVSNGANSREVFIKVHSRWQLDQQKEYIFSPQFSKPKLILLKLITLSSYLLRYVSVFQSCVIFYSSSVHVGRKPLIQVDTGQVLCRLYIAFLLQISQTISVLWPLLLIDMNF